VRGARGRAGGVCLPAGCPAEGSPRIRGQARAAGRSRRRREAPLGPEGRTRSLRRAALLGMATTALPPQLLTHHGEGRGFAQSTETFPCWDTEDPPRRAVLRARRPAGDRCRQPWRPGTPGTGRAPPSGGPPPPPPADRHRGAAARARDAPGCDQPDVRWLKPHCGRRSCSPAAPATAPSSAAVSTRDPGLTWSPAGQARARSRPPTRRWPPPLPSRRSTGAPPNRTPRHPHKPGENLSVRVPARAASGCKPDASRDWLQT
jgi:hypothetical protein